MRNPGTCVGTSDGLSVMFPLAATGPIDNLWMPHISSSWTSSNKFLGFLYTVEGSSAADLPPWHCQGFLDHVETSADAALPRALVLYHLFI
eukprot:6332437-Amphidinium_carterae.1